MRIIIMLAFCSLLIACSVTGPSSPAVPIGQPTRALEGTPSGASSWATAPVDFRNNKAIVSFGNEKFAEGSPSQILDLNIVMADGVIWEEVFFLTKEKQWKRLFLEGEEQWPGWMKNAANVHVVLERDEVNIGGSNTIAFFACEDGDTLKCSCRNANDCTTWSLKDDWSSNTYWYTFQYYATDNPDDDQQICESTGNWWISKEICPQLTAGGGECAERTKCCGDDIQEIYRRGNDDSVACCPSDDETSVNGECVLDTTLYWISFPYVVEATAKDIVQLAQDQGIQCPRALQYNEETQSYITYRKELDIKDFTLGDKPIGLDCTEKPSISPPNIPFADHSDETLSEGYNFLSVLPSLVGEKLSDVVVGCGDWSAQLFIKGSEGTPIPKDHVIEEGDTLVVQCTEAGIFDASDVTVAGSVCRDSDNGKNMYTKGSTEAYGGYSGGAPGVDSCVISIPEQYTYKNERVEECTGDNCQVTEHYCKNGDPFSVLADCPNGCKNGACIESAAITSKCVDSDAMDYFSKNTVLTKDDGGNPIGTTDICCEHCFTAPSPTGTFLHEATCEGDEKKVVTKECMSGCSDGACTRSNFPKGLVYIPILGDTDMTAKDLMEMTGSEFVSRATKTTNGYSEYETHVAGNTDFPLESGKSYLVSTINGFSLQLPPVDESPISYTLHRSDFGRDQTGVNYISLAKVPEEIKTVGKLKEKLGVKDVVSVGPGPLGRSIYLIHDDSEEINVRKGYAMTTDTTVHFTISTSGLADVSFDKNPDPCQTDLKTCLDGVAVSRDINNDCQFHLCKGEFRNPTIDGRPIDNCLHFGKDCQKPAADAFCANELYKEAVEWEVASIRPTYIIGDDKICDADYCAGFSRIQCIGGVKSYDPEYNGEIINQNSETLQQFCEEKGLDFHSKTSTLYNDLPNEPNRVLGGSGYYVVDTTTGYNNGKWEVQPCSAYGWTWDDCYSKLRTISCITKNKVRDIVITPNVVITGSFDFTRGNLFSSDESRDSKPFKSGQYSLDIHNIRTTANQAAGNCDWNKVGAINHKSIKTDLSYGSALTQTLATTSDGLRFDLRYGGESRFSVVGKIDHQTPFQECHGFRADYVLTKIT